MVTEPIEKGKVFFLFEQSSRATSTKVGNFPKIQLTIFFSFNHELFFF